MRSPLRFELIRHPAIQSSLAFRSPSNPRAPAMLRHQPVVRSPQPQYRLVKVPRRELDQHEPVNDSCRRALRGSYLNGIGTKGQGPEAIRTRGGA